MKDIKVVKALIKGGANLTKAPMQVPPLQGHDDLHLKYRQSPFILQAASYGTIEIFKTLLDAGCSIAEVGHICLSKRRQHSVVSNVIGASAYHGNKDILDFCSKTLDWPQLDLKAIETADRDNKKSGHTKSEYVDFTPL